MNENLLKEKALDFIIEQDEYTNIIKNKQIDKGSKLLVDFVIRLHEIGIIEIKNKI